MTWTTEMTSNNERNIEARHRLEQLDALRKEAGRMIDAETAETTWWYVPILDPYCNLPYDPEVHDYVGRGYFASAPGGDEWIYFSDLPADTRDKLWRRDRSELAFPAGLGLGLEAIREAEVAN
jgi:hypothetical protein